MTRIFISYDRDDRATTRQLAAQLRRIYGHDQVWYDEDIRGGEDWWAEIQERIAAADIFLFLLSPHSVQSEYCERERLAAAARSKKVLPVRIGSVDPLPAHFRSIQYVDMPRGEITVDTFTELTAAIHALDPKRRSTTEMSVVNLPPAANAPAPPRNWRLWFGGAAALVAALLLLGVLKMVQDFPLPAGTLAFTTTRDGNTEIYRADGGLGGWFSTLSRNNPRNLTQNRSSDASADWSSDGRRLAFVSSADGQTAIYVMNIESNDPPRQLVNGLEPAWSPDGTRIAFASKKPGQDGRDIMLMNADGSGLTTVTDTPDIDETYPDWSPDGTQLVYQARARLVTNEATLDDPGGLGLANTPTTQWERWDIFRHDLETGAATNLTSLPDADDSQPAWSPDGQYIAFKSNRERLLSVSIDGLEQTIDTNPEVYAILAAGGEALDLTNNTASDAFPAWSPNGRYLAFVSARDGNEEVYVMETACLATACLDVIPRRITASGASDVEPTWRPS